MRPQGTAGIPRTSIAAALGAALLSAACQTPPPLEGALRGDSPQAQACHSPEAAWPAYRARIEAAKPDVAWRELTGEARRRVLDAYNATPPASAFDPDLLGYFDDGHPLVVVLAFVEKGCVWQAVPAPRHLVVGSARPAGIKI